MAYRIAWIGPRDRAEWNFVWQELEQEGRRTLSYYPSIAAVKPAESLDLAVVAVSCPGGHSLDDVRRLQDSRPDARVVCLLGAWCSGLRRVTPALAEIPNLYVHEVRPGSVFQQLTTGEAVPANQSGGSQSSAMVAIYARSDSYRAALSESLSPYFRHRIELSFDQDTPASGVDVIVWEMSPYPEEWLAESKTLKRRHPEARCIALANYPRTFERQEIESLPGVAVLAQPFPLDALVNMVVESARVAPTMPLRASA